MILEKRVYGNFQGNPFIIGSTVKNQYFPIYAVSMVSSNVNRSDILYYNGDPLSEELLPNVFLYKKPLNVTNERYANLNKYADLFYHLSTTVKPSSYEFTYSDVSYFLNCNKGYLADSDDNILLCLCTKDKNVFDNEGKLIFSNLRLFISNRLIKEEKYKNVYKKILIEYIDYCYQNNIDVFFTTSENIENQIFKNDFVVEYSNLTELNNHLNSNIGENLFFESPVFDEDDEQGIELDLDNMTVETVGSGLIQQIEEVNVYNSQSNYVGYVTTEGELQSSNEDTVRSYSTNISLEDTDLAF